MSPDVLRDQLAKLHEELRRVSSVDPRSSELLGEIMDEIKRLMPQSYAGSPSLPSLSPAAPAAAASAASAAASSLSGRLEEIAVQFEADHPTLAASSRRLVDLLGKAGL
jgi:hypothetical protein